MRYTNSYPMGRRLVARLVLGALVVWTIGREASVVRVLIAQAPADQTQAPQQFEVASIKPNKSGDGRVMLGFQPGGRFVATNIALRMLITQAYRIQPFQLINAPDWAASERYDINAKGDVAPEQMRDAMPQLMQSLLADRFGLVAHRETREMPIYALVKARDDGRLGPQLKPTTVDCEALRPGRGAGPGGPPPPPQAPPTGTVALGRGGPAGMMGCGTRIGPGTINATGATIAGIIAPLSQMTGRVVVDKTGLTGRHDIELTWTPEQGTGAGPDAPSLAPGAAASLFTAIQEQLGLKLESQRGPVEVVVVDKVSPPTPD